MIGLVRVVLGRPELMGFSSRASRVGSVWFSKNWYRILLSNEYLGSELCRILAFDFELAVLLYFLFVLGVSSCSFSISRAVFFLEKGWPEFPLQLMD